MATDYQYYTGTYFGNSIPEADFPKLEKRASDELTHYKRIWIVTGTEDNEKMAVCAVADVMYYFETLANGGIAKSSSIGSVSSSFDVAEVDASDAAQADAVCSAAKTYLSIYKGVRQCR